MPTPARTVTIVALLLLGAAGCKRGGPAGQEPEARPEREQTGPERNPSAVASGDAVIPTVAGGKSALLVELFTSQGCSSCPPADEYLSVLGENGVGEVDVIPLAFHVDYWNYIGWTDPFSSARWSERQRDYALRVAAGRVYTPQLFIAGRRHEVGSSRRRVADAVRDLADSAIVPIGGSYERTGERVTVDVAASLPALKSEQVELWVAVTESGIETEVRRGENAGRELANDHVVRDLALAAKLTPGEQGRGRVELSLPATDNEIGVVAFVQDPHSKAILGASRLAAKATDSE